VPIPAGARIAAAIRVSTNGVEAAPGSTARKAAQRSACGGGGAFARLCRQRRSQADERGFYYRLLCELVGKQY